MKRIISLVLAIALLCSFVPVALAETATPVLAFELGAADPRTATAEDGTTISYYRVPVAVKNNSESDVLISTYECYLKFDAQSINVVDTKGIELEDGSYLEAVEKGENGTVSAWNKPSVGLLDNGNCVGAVLANDAGVRALKVKPDASVTLIYVNFVAAEDAEKGFKSIQFAKDVYRSDNTLAVNLVSYYDETTKTTTDYSESDGALDCSSETTVEVKTGTTPVLARVELVADDDNLEIPYGTEKEITLKAFSKKNTDVTSFVTFSIDGYTGDGLKIRDNQLTVSAENPANVGTYTVVATPDGTNCTLAEGASAPEATFTIIPKKITNPKVAITGFAKGNDIHWDLKIEPKDTAGLISNRVNCYEGPGVTDKPTNSGKFKPDTIYTFAITLDAMENYELGEGTLTYTINGGEEMTTPIVEKNDFPTPYYQAIVTAATAGLDSPTLELDELTATYGDLLSSFEPKGTATFNSKPIDGRFTWSTEYDADTKVGDAGENTFNVVFTPTESEVYATVTGTVKVNVAKKQITFTKSDYKWRASNDETPTEVKSDGEIVFTYDGKEHGIEAYCDNSAIADDVEIVYDSGERSFTSSKGSTVTAHVEVKDKKNYELDGGPNIQSGFIRILPIVVNYDGEYTHSVDVCYTTSSVDIPLSAFGLPDEVLNDTNNKYWMRTDAVVVDEGDVISGTPTAFDDTTLTLTLNLKNSLTKADANKTATVTLGLKVNNYETINPGVEEIAGGEDKLFILKLNVKIIEKEDAGLEVFGIPETMVYGDTVRAGSPDGYYHTVKKEGKNATFSAMISDIAVVAFDDDEGLAAKGVGTATITCTYESDTTFATKTFTINVTPKGLTANVSHDPITYGDAAPEDGYTVEFDGLVNGDNITDYTVGTEYTAGKPAGTYKITCALGDSIKNYTLEAKDVTGELVVKPKQLTAEDVTVTVLGETPVYDGSEKIPAVEVKYGETTLAAADYTVSYSNNVNAGVNTASVTVTSNDNSSYKFTATKNFTIASAPISGAMIVNIPSVTYDTKAHTPEVTVTFNGSKLTDADYTVSYSEDCINAGMVTVTVTGKGNFTGTASKTFTINKAGLTLNPCTISELCTETDLKTRTLPSDFFLAGETETGFSIELTAVAGGDDIFAVAPAVVEGENKITFRLKNEVGAATFTVTVTPVSGNYNGGSYALTISTHDRTDVSGSIEFKDGSAVYTGSGITYERATLNGNSFNMTYSYKPTSTGATLDAKGLPLTVGTYTVTADYSDANSYGTAQATFTITKATPTGTPGYTKLESSGKTLADAKLTVGTIRPAGTIAWDLPLTTVLEDGKAYAWTFTPNDTHNYTILTGTLVPYVDDGMDYIPGVIGGNTGSFNFHDVNRLDYFYNAVKWAAENGIASGTGRYTFSPDAVCTRAQTVTFLWRAAGSPLPRYRVCPFTDVQPSDYYYNAVLWAVEQGITTGLNATTFGPDVTVTRGQVATFLYRAASAAKPNTFNPFADVKTTAYNYDAILWAYDNRITTGTSDTTFSPDAYCTRAQIVTFLYRYSQGR